MHVSVGVIYLFDMYKPLRLAKATVTGIGYGGVKKINQRLHFHIMGSHNTIIKKNTERSEFYERHSVSNFSTSADLKNNTNARKIRETNSTNLFTQESDVNDEKYEEANVELGKGSEDCDFLNFSETHKKTETDNLGSAEEEGSDDDESLNRKLSDYDTENSRSVDANLFKTVDEELKYQIEKCLGSLSPNFKGSKKKSGESYVSNKYQYLRPDEAIDIINKREYTLISIDNEFYERGMNKVTEIGISIYNPNYQRYAFCPHIPSIHFIIKEHLNLRNGKYVPDLRMQNITGQSIVISASAVPQAMSLIFDTLGEKSCIVGHNVSGDIQSFKNLDYTIPHKFKIIDTTNLWYSMLGTKNAKSSLAYILDKLSIPNSFLHNGANDAYYTLLVCLMLASPEIRNNLLFKRKILAENKKKKIDPPKLDEMPDFANFPPEIAEKKKKSWMKKAKKLIERSRKAELLGPEIDQKDLLFRYNIEDSTISRKHNLTDRPKYNKTKKPPANKFFTPKAFKQRTLLDRLEQLTL